MLLKHAIELIKHEAISKNQKQIWADLGSGTGTFTLALADFLSQNSNIYAVDNNKSALNKIPDNYKGTIIKKLHGDFIEIELPNNLDGILMANSLHYVSDRDFFIRKIIKHLKRESCFLIIEYDMDIPTPWIPFPISYNSLKQLFENIGYYSVQKINERSSIYRKEKIYSSLIRNNF